MNQNQQKFENNEKLLKKEVWILLKLSSLKDCLLIRWKY